MADIRITPASSIMAFTSSLSFKETLTQDASGSIVLFGSGSTGRTNVFAIDGGSGRLFSVDDDLSDSLFSVNTIAGLPVIEAFANNTVNIGKYGAYSFVATGSGDARIGSGSVMFVSASGNVGIGTTNPQSKLSVDGGDIKFNSGNAAANYYVSLNHNSSNDGGIIWARNNTPDWQMVNATSGDFWMYSYGTATVAFTLQKSSGNVGIGTTNPSYKLHVEDTNPRILVKATSTGYAINYLQNDGGTLQTFLDNSTGGGFGFGNYVRGVYSTGAYDFILTSNATERMRITSAGNVGIGTSSPTAYTGYTTLALDNATNGGLLDLRNNGTSALRLSADSTSLVSIYGATNVPMAFSTNATERMRITAAGNVGIGTTGGFNSISGTETTLHIVNSNAASLYLNATSGKKWALYGASLGFNIYNATDGITPLVITNAGLVGIGTTSPTQNLEVNGVIESPYLEFKPVVFYDFNSDTTGEWNKTNSTLSVPSNSVTRYTSTGTDSNINKSFNFSGGQNQIIRIRYKVISGTVGSGEIFYSNSQHGFSGSYLKTFSLVADGQWHTLVLDMSQLTSGGTDWIDYNVTAIRFDLTNNNSVVIDLDWISIGGNGYGTQYFENDVAFTNGSVGIGTTSPGNRLDVRYDDGVTSGEHNVLASFSRSGTGPLVIGYRADGTSVSSALIRIGDSLPLTIGTTSTNQAFILLNNGNVGIGITTPQAPLSFANTAGNKIDFYHSTVSTGDRYGIQVQSDQLIIHSGAAGLSTGGILLGKSTTSTFTEAMRITNGGNVGIGTTNPGTKLEVSGAIRGGSFSASVTNTGEAWFGRASDRTLGTMTFQLGGSSATSTGFEIVDRAWSKVMYYFSGEAPGNSLYVNSSGNVGIGVSNPGAKLQVGSASTSSELLRIGVAYSVANSQRGAIAWHDGSGITGKIWTEYDGSTYTKLNFGGLYSSSLYDQGTFLTIRGNGNVGIGNTTPLYKLIVEGNTNAAPVAAISNTAVGGHLVYMGYNDGTNRTAIGIEDGGGNASSYGIQVGTYFAVRDDGRVGIGTTNPSSTLQVVGNVVATSFTGSFSGSLTGTITTATNATNITVTADTTNISRYLTFVGSTSGNNGTLVNADLLYNPSTDLLSINNMWVWKGKNNTANSDNVFIGSGSGANLSAWASNSADRNTGLGHFTGNALTTGRANMMFGFGAGQLLTTGSFNVFIGQQAGVLSTTNTGNCALGSLSYYAFQNASSNYNTAIGYLALRGTVASSGSNTAAYNVAIGNEAGVTTTSGNYNTIVGSYAGGLITSGGGNTLIGSGSGASITTGTHNTLVGKYAGTTTLTSTVVLSDGLGNIKFHATGSRTTISGSLAIGGIAASATVGRFDASNDVVAYSTSDIRLKENIQPIENALYKVNQISGNTFDWKSDPELTILHGFKGKDIGIIAQEIESILPEVVTTRDSGYKAVKYEKLVPLLIEAIKELTDKVNNLEEQLKNK